MDMMTSDITCRPT